MQEEPCILFSLGPFGLCMPAQLCLTFCDPMDCRLPGSSVHGILQAGILEQVVISFSKGSSQPRFQTHNSVSPALVGWFLYQLSHQVYKVSEKLFQYLSILRIESFTVWASKESACNAGDLGLTPGLGRSPGIRHSKPLQYSILENSMDRGAWQTTVHGVTKSQTQLSGHGYRPWGLKEVNTTEQLIPWGQNHILSTKTVSDIWNICNIIV